MDEIKSSGKIIRWLPVIVVFGVVGGFMMLAWYAYNAGTQSVQDDNLLVVEADKAPIKEKPVNPGGMQFPNQDKTIFDTFSAGNTQQPAKVERVLPSPEEPMARSVDNSGTTTWINDNLHKNDGKESPSAGPEKVIGSEEQKTEVATAETPKFQVIQAKPQHVPEEVRTEVVKEKEVEKPVEAPKAEAPKAMEAAPVAEEQKPAAELPSAGKGKKVVEQRSGTSAVQLGSYRSEKEAMASWAKMQKRFDVLSVREPNIMRADLGEKGVYYRLRVGGFLNPVEAKTFCEGLSAAGQACIPAGK